jgi:hypothetical protein
VPFFIATGVVHFSHLFLLRVPRLIRSCARRACECVLPVRLRCSFPLLRLCVLVRQAHVEWQCVQSPFAAPPRPCLLCCIGCCTAACHEECA